MDDGKMGKIAQYGVVLGILLREFSKDADWLPLKLSVTKLDTFGFNSEYLDCSITSCQGNNREERSAIYPTHGKN